MFPTSIEVQQAFALMQRGLTEQAEHLLQRRLVADPHDPATHRMMGLVAARTSRIGLAIQHLTTACERAPDSGMLHCELGRVLASNGQLEPALKHFHNATTLEPGQVEGWMFFGITALRLHRIHEGLLALRHAHSLTPQDQQVLAELANAEFHHGHPDDALPLWQELTRRRPDDVDNQLRLAETLSRLGLHGEAIESYQAALQRLPGSADLWMALGQAHEDSGERGGARTAYEAALTIKPGWAFPLSGLLGIQRASSPPPLIEQAQRLQHGDSLSDAERALIGYQLGKVHDGRGDYPAAFDSWRDANQARRRMTAPLDREALDQWVQRVIGAGRPPPQWATDPASSDDSRPIFVVGMPRSGTTLTEQIIAAHPQAFGCGELPDIALIARRLGDAGRSPATPQQLLREKADLYLASASRHAPTDAKRLVDKAPLNFFNLDLIARMLPRARVIWCRRDPRDIGLSIYSENFGLEATFATDLADIAHYINAHDALMQHWQSVLPIPILELQYADMVSSPETHARRLIEFVGLPWDPACLQFHQSTRGVQTPSRWQVREPIHTRSLGRWRHYLEQLEPLVQALDHPPPRTDESP